MVILCWHCIRARSHLMTVMALSILAFAGLMEEGGMDCIDERGRI